MRHLALLALVLGLAAACRGSNNGGDDTQTPDAQNTDDVRIQDIQNDSMAECDPADAATCTPFAIRGVIVTAIDNYGADTGTLWVQEPEGGPFSGVKVYRASLDQVAALAPGDIVDIEGAVKEEFACEPCMKPDMSGRSLTEIKSAPGGQLTITKKSSGAVPEPAQVDALAIGMLDPAARDAEWEKWEGVLIRVSNVAQTAKEYAPDMPDPDEYEFRITGSISVRSALAALPANNHVNDCYASITGVGDYFFNWLLMPRTESDFGGAGAACPAPETSCDDGIDNDGNGFKDCADNSCALASATCRKVTTIEAIQTAATPPTGGIELENVCVSALARATGTPATSKNLWVQSSDGLATANNGIYIYGPGTDYGAFTAGKKVNILGTVKEFNNNTGTGTLTQILATSVMATGDTCTPTPILNQSADNLSMDAAGEPLESVLIELKNVKITTAADPNNYYVGQMQQGTKTFTFDDDIFRVTAAASTTTCYSFTGIWSYQVYNDAWYFLPTQAGTTTTCP